MITGIVSTGNNLNVFGRVVLTSLDDDVCMKPARAFTDDLISKESFDAQLAEHGVEIPAFRMRNWRTRGLMPHSFRGGLACYAPESVAQALEADRLFKEKDDEAHVGWELWWQGFDVSDDYWQSWFEDRGALRRTITRHAAQAASAIAMSSRNRLETVIWRLHASLSGDQTDLDLAGHASLQRLAALQGADGARILQDGVDISKAFAQAMTAIANTEEPNVSSLMFKQNSRHILFQARDDLRGILEAGAAMHDAAALLLPGRARRLKAAKFMSERASRALKAELVLRYNQSAEDYGPRMDSAAIVNLRADAFATLSAARELRRAIDVNPSMKAAATPKRLREAAATRPGLDTLCDAVCAAVSR